MGLLKRIENWLNKKPLKEDLFFVNIRESYQNIHKVFTNEQLVKILCTIIYVTSLVLLAIDIKMYNYLHTSTLVVCCFAIVLFIARTLCKQDKDFAVF